MLILEEFEEDALEERDENVSEPDAFEELIIAQPPWKERTRKVRGEDQAPVEPHKLQKIEEITSSIPLPLSPSHLQLSLLKYKFYPSHPHHETPYHHHLPRGPH